MLTPSGEASVGSLRSPAGKHGFSACIDCLQPSEFASLSGAGRKTLTNGENPVLHETSKRLRERRVPRDAQKRACVFVIVAIHTMTGAEAFGALSHLRAPVPDLVAVVE